MKGIILFAWTALITELVSAQCPAGWSLPNGNSFPRCMLCRTSQDTSVRTVWRPALDDCNARGGTLTGIHSTEQEQFVRDCVASVTSPTEPAWVGLVRPDGGNAADLDEAWLDGRAVIYGKSIIIDNGNVGRNCFVYTRVNTILNQDCDARDSAYVCSRAPSTCLLPDSPHYGILSALSPAIADVPTGFAYSGQTISYQCSTGYLPSSAAVRTCQLDGTWFPAAPLCEPVNCGLPQEPQFGAVSAPVTTLNAQACYSCDDGYVITGSTTATCQASGSWSPSDAPVCAAAATTTSTTTTTPAPDEDDVSVPVLIGATVGAAVFSGLVTGVVCSMLAQRPALPGGAPPGILPPIAPRFPPVMQGIRPRLPRFGGQRF